MGSKGQLSWEEPRPSQAAGREETARQGTRVACLHVCEPRGREQRENRTLSPIRATHLPSPAPTLMMGVMNSTRKPGTRSSEG